MSTIIDKVEAIAIEVPLPKPFAGATYTVPTRNTVITRIYTKDGLVSEVFNGDNRKCGPDVVKLIHEQIAPLIIGEDALEHEKIWAQGVHHHQAARRSQVPDGSGRLCRHGRVGP